MTTHWAYAIADQLISKYGEKQITCAAGISPSGIVHAGNLRELMTSDLVFKALVDRGANARLIFSWDDFDRFRKVPANIPESFREHVGKAYCEIPDPYGKFNSYAERFEHLFEGEAKQLGIEATFIRQNQMYKDGSYDNQIRFVLQNRKNIADILARNMTQGMSEEEINNYFPVSIYSRFSGKDTTRVISFDGENKLTYECKETGKEDTVDLTKDHVIKLPWKVDWPMRWKYEGVHFEPGGSDHASPQGSYDVGGQIAKEIFGIQPPDFVEYHFVRIKGMNEKMSSSKGNVFSPSDLLNIYSPMMVRWLYCKQPPNSLIDIAFDADVIRTYEEFDKKILKFLDGQLEENDRQEILLSKPSSQTNLARNSAPFRQIAGMGDATNFNHTRILELLNDSNMQFDTNSIEDRLNKSNIWMDKYCQDQRSKLLLRPNISYYNTLTSEGTSQINMLLDVVNNSKSMSLEQLEQALYAIPKKPGMSDEDKKIAQRTFFKNVYNLLFDKDRGPRLPTFIWAADTTTIAHLLNTHNG
jgi:lysyl-tRNA synthetase class 1